MIWVYHIPVLLFRLALVVLILNVLLAYIRLLKYRKDLNWLTAILKVPSAMLKPVRGFAYNTFEQNLQEYDKKMKAGGAKRLGWGPQGMFLYVGKTGKIHVYSGHTDQEFVFEPENTQGG